MTAGYPGVVIPVEHREDHMAALEKASVEGNIEGFVRFVGGGDVRKGVFFCAKSDEWEKICIFALLNAVL